MSPTANITSVEAVRALKLALVEFADEVQAALVALELEARRAMEWVERDRSRYWPREIQRASDRLSEARIALERAELKIGSEDRRYAYDERKAVERAKRRLQLAEAKTEAVRRWRVQIRKDVDQFAAQVAKMRQFLDTDQARAIANLEQMAAALDRYIEAPTPGNTGARAMSSVVAGASSSAEGTIPEATQ